VQYIHGHRKGLSVVFAVLLFGIAIVPSSTADTSFQRTTIGDCTALASQENRSYVNLTLPPVHITYDVNKWKWGVVTFDDFELVFDVNLSSFEYNMILIGFNETIYCHTQSQLFPAFHLTTLELFWNDTFFGGISTSRPAWSQSNWTTQEHISYFTIFKDLFNNTDIRGRITVTGIPLRLHFLYGTSQYFLLWWWIINGNMLLPFEERHGTMIEFTLHFHS
jgi:hypothetical protein